MLEKQGNVSGMKLSEREATILAAAELRAQAPIEILRKESGYREHTVRYALRNLLGRGVIAPIPFINLHRLGYTIYSLFFTVGGEKRGAHDALIRSLIAAPNVLWVGEFGGEFQYGVGFCAKRLPSLVEFLTLLSKKHGAIFHDKAISVQIASTIFPRRYLSSKKFSVRPLTVTFDKKEVVSIDALDSKILSGLTSFGQLSHRQLALKLQVPLSTLELRLRKLREAGVIAADIFVVDASKFHMESFKLLVYTKGLDAELSTRMHDFCARHRNITTLIDCFGSWGYEVNVEVERAEEVTRIIQEMYQELGGSIHTIKTLTKFRYPKVRFFVEEGGALD
jgi:Lrp/AsnC family transcriptional regulator